jgi:transcriptional regulator with XRE-family HTH domain
MNAMHEALREELKDQEYSEGYAESFLDSYVATQIKVLREQAGLSQEALGKLVGTRQGVISRIENVNYSKWNVATLKKLARAFNVRLRVSFETYGSLISEVEAFSRENLQRAPRDKDPILYAARHAAPRPHRSFLKGLHVHYTVNAGNYANGQLQQTLFGSQPVLLSQFDRRPPRPIPDSANNSFLEAAS